MGVMIADTKIKMITLVKNMELRRPSSSPFWATIKATSPRFIIPTPILRESLPEKWHRRAIPPQPTTLDSRPTTRKARVNRRS